MDSILEGVRVLDMTIWQQGPYSTAMLADLGADVIHIEGPETPDIGRNFGGAPQENGLNAYFHAHNRGKRAIVLDLKKPQAREVLYRLVATADVFMSNMRFAALERLGADYDSIVKYNPSIVYAHGSGYGPEGPDANNGSMDILGQARGGIMAANAVDGVPRGNAVAIADHVGAITMAFGIMSALYHRQRTGEGQKVDSSLLGAQMCIQSFQITTTLFNGNAKPPTRRTDRRDANNPTWNTYKGSDGRWFCLGMTTDAFWPGICGVIEKPEWLTHEHFGTLAGRLEHNRELIALLDELFASAPADEWIRRFSEKNLLATPVNAWTDLRTDPQVVANKYIVEVERPDGGAPVEIVGPPVTFSKTPAHIRGLAPEFDQHTEEVLLEAGYDWSEIEALRREGVIGARDEVPAALETKSAI